MTENINNEENSEVIQTKKMDAIPRQLPETFELKCSSCGVIGELEEYMDEFDCPQCGGKMYPLEKTKKDLTETTKLSSVEQETLEVETATISISKAQINEYKKNIKVAKPVDIGIFSSGVPSMSSAKGMSTSSKSLGASAPASPVRPSTSTQSASGALPPITRTITSAFHTPTTSTATHIRPDPILEKELETLRKRKEKEEQSRRNKEPEADVTQTRVEIDTNEIALAQKLEIERLRAEGLEKLLQEESIATQQEKEQLKQEQEAHQQQVLEAQEALQRERDELEKRKIELQELERRFQSPVQDEQEIVEVAEEPESVIPVAPMHQNNTKLIIIIAVAMLFFMIIFGIIVFMIGKSSAAKSSDSRHILLQKTVCDDGQWRGRQTLI